MSKIARQGNFRKLGHNLELLMLEAKVSANQLSQNTGIPTTTIKRLKTDTNANPTLTSLIPIANFFMVSLGQLIGDEPLPKNRVKGEYIANPDFWKDIPILTWEEVIQWPNINYDEPHDFTKTEYLTNTKAYALKVIENNWENMAQNTILIINPNIKPEHRDYAVVHKKEQKKATIKQVLFDEDIIYLKPIIADYNIIKYDYQHKFLGVVVQSKMKFK